MESRYYRIARKAAEIITEHEDTIVEFKDVILHGSTLRKEDPGDIDFLLLHSGRSLASFTMYSKQDAEDAGGVAGQNTGSLPIRSQGPRQDQPQEPAQRCR